MISFRIVSEIMWFWRKLHPPLSKNSAWRKAREAECNAIRRNCTKDIGRARQDMSKAVLDDLRRV